MRNSTKLPPAEAAQAQCLRETMLYAPVKAFLESRGYEVKGEIRGCDLVACRGAEPPIIVELKLRLNLALLLQGIDRLALSERVYLAVPRPPSRRSRGVAPDSAAMRRLCRRLGLGLLVVGGRSARVDVVEEPVPYRPRLAKRRTELLLREFTRRLGDPNVGGDSRTPVVTAYRQDALRCARALADAGPMRLGDLRAASGVPRAAQILQRNVYGWFARVGRGTYALTASGDKALAHFAGAVSALAAHAPASVPAAPT
ncbi:MAG: hypothetical protein JO038_08200 [Alphaproteobacteria bacterium]|nr:hypothetical protein [Alphaproteobacteria bacterium]